MIETLAPHVVIGGLGGSGTRLVASVVASTGIDLGCELNGAFDNLWVTLLFKHVGLLDTTPDEFAYSMRILAQATQGGAPLDAVQQAFVRALAVQDRPQHPRDWLQARAQSLIDSAAGPRKALPRAWGWKEPNSHMLLPFFEQLPATRYIHVVRDGLTMAHSSNRNQLWYWGEPLTGQPMELTPRYALHYWCAALARAEHLGAALGDRFLLLDYDRLCREPEPVVAEIDAFLGAPAPVDLDLVARIRAASDLPEPDADLFDAEDLSRARAWRVMSQHATPDIRAA